MPANHRLTLRLSLWLSVGLLPSLVLADQPPVSAAAAAARHPYEAFTEPYQVIAIAAAQPGRVSAVHVKRGAHVAPGDLLIELDSTVLQATRRVAKQRSEAVAKIEALTIEQRLKDRRHKTLIGLRQEGAGSVDELFLAESEAKISAANIQAAHEEIELHRLEVAELDTQIAERKVCSQITGIVSEVHKHVGEYVSAAEPTVITVVDLSQLRATFYVPTAEATALRVGQKIAVRQLVDDRPVVGEIEHVGAITQADSGRVRVDTLINNVSGNYRSGLRCVVDLMLDPETSNAVVNEPAAISKLERLGQQKNQ